MPLPKVAIVGRPNVGKSSIFNWLARKRIAVVDQVAGVTRDRVTYLMHEDGRWFELIDTGGMGVVDADFLTEDIERQIHVAIEEADLVLFAVDGKEGVMPLDEEVAERLRPVAKPTLLVVNKCDSPRTEQEMYQFFALMDVPAVTVSVLGNRNRKELLQAVLEHLPPPSENEQAEGEVLSAEPELKLAIVGRRNVGKSTFINALAEAERVIVSELPGTTRDSIDVRFEVDGKAVIAIDTPGVRRRKSMHEDYEFYGLVRSRRSIRRADVVLMFFDATKTISKVDKQLVSEIHENNKPCVFVVNKWDLGQTEGMTTEAWATYLERTFGTMRYVPVAFLTARSGKNIKKVVNLAQSIFKQSRIRVGTGPLNKVVQAAIRHKQPPFRKGKRPKIFYATQVATEPPTIVLKCNDPELFDDTWLRYLLGVLRDELPFHEVPIKLYLRPRHREEAEETSLEEAVRGREVRE